MPIITSPLDLWRGLCSSAGLELRLKGGRPGRDADIEEALRSALTVPNAAQSLDAWLVSDAASVQPRISTEQLLVEVMKSQGGFARMMQDILGVLITAQAQQSSHPLSVAFKFDDVSDPLKATLEQFRDVVRRTQRALEMRPKLPNSGVMWGIFDLLRDFVTARPNNAPPGFPPFPAIAPTGHAGLDTQLARLAQLVLAFTDLWRRHGATRRQVCDSALAMPDAELRGQLIAATDYWDVSMLSGAQEISNQVNSGQIDPKETFDRLADALSNIEWGEVWVERAIQEMLDVLKLPAWRRRHELYSVWVGTRMLKVLERVVPDMRFHRVNGELSFEFRGSRLATFTWSGKQYDVWAELRSALVGRSSKRKRGIQPDFRVLLADLSRSANAQTTYVLECKHYLTASTWNFTQAAADYARSCPNAVVHVVNHGPTDEQALNAALPLNLQSRVRFIGSATPLQEAVTQVLGNAIRDALFPGQPLPAQGPAVPELAADKAAPTIAPGCVGYALLTWDGSLDDMDLALQVVGPDGRAKQTIDFHNKGELGTAPFARLVEDIRHGPGMERIDISAWHFSRYKLIATNYSKSGQMTPKSLYCNIVTDNGLTQMCCPAELSATCYEWKIAELRVNNGVVAIIPCNCQ